MGVAGQWSEAVKEDLDAMMNVLEEVMRIIATAESKDDKITTWQIRVQLASSILDLILIDTEVCSQAPILSGTSLPIAGHMLHAQPLYPPPPISSLSRYALT